MTLAPCDYQTRSESVFALAIISAMTPALIACAAITTFLATPPVAPSPSQQPCSVDEGNDYVLESSTEYQAVLRAAQFLDDLTPALLSNRSHASYLVQQIALIRAVADLQEITPPECVADYHKLLITYGKELRLAIYHLSQERDDKAEVHLDSLLSLQSDIEEAWNVATASSQ